MFEERYNRMMEGVEPSQELVRRTKEAAQPRKTQARAWKPVMLMALCVMLMAGAVFWKTLAAHPTLPLDQTAASTQPPILTEPSGDFHLQLISSSVIGETSYILLAAEGSGVSESLTLDVEWTINGSETIYAQMISPIDYTSYPNRATYLLTTERTQNGFRTSQTVPLSLGDTVTMTLMRWWHATDDGSTPEITQDGETTLRFNMGGVGDKYACDGYIYEILADGTVKLYTDLWFSSDPVVPAELDGLRVSSIGTAFAANDKLKSITLPEGIKVIDVNAFMDCKNLKEIHLPDGLLEIAPTAFAGCSALESIHIPDSVTTIGAEAFAWCTSLKEIHLPASLTDLGYNAFSHASLEYVDIPDGLTYLPEFAFSSAFSQPCVSIPASVTDIHDTAFHWGVSKLIVVPDSYAEDFARALGYTYEYAEGSEPAPRYVSGDWTYTVQPNGAARLENYTGTETRIIVPGTLDGRAVSSVGVGFAGNDTITHITLPERMTEIAQMAFCNCSALESVQLPDNLVRIGQYAFYNCDALVEFELPNNLQTIGNFAFYGCDSLREITIPASVTEIGEFVLSSYPRTTTLHVAPDSYAETYAKEHSLAYLPIETD